MKRVGYLAIKCYKQLANSGIGKAGEIVIGVKPLELSIFKDRKEIA